MNLSMKKKDWSHLQQISKMFKTKNQTEIKGIDKLVTMSSMSE